MMISALETKVLVLKSKNHQLLLPLMSNTIWQQSKTRLQHPLPFTLTLQLQNHLSASIKIRRTPTMNLIRVTRMTFRVGRIAQSADGSLLDFPQLLRRRGRSERDRLGSVQMRVEQALELAPVKGTGHEDQDFVSSPFSSLIKSFKI